MNNDQKFRIAISQLLNQWEQDADEHERIYVETGALVSRAYADMLRARVVEVEAVFAALPNA